MVLRSLLEHCVEAVGGVGEHGRCEGLDGSTGGCSVWAAVVSSGGSSGACPEVSTCLFTQQLAASSGAIETKVVIAFILAGSSQNS